MLPADSSVADRPIRTRVAASLAEVTSQPSGPAAAHPLRRRVRSGEVALAVVEHSPGGGGRPTVLLVHGYPDRQETWDPLLARLPLDAWHVVTYDVRGAGGSDAPRERAAYRTERLVDDLVAVLDAVTAGRGERVHLVGHDWGSVQLWDAVATESDDPRLRGRIASFTSVSGPSLDHVNRVLGHPRGRRRAVRRQQRASWYVAAFCVPVLPDLAWRLGHRRIGAYVARRQRLPRDHWGPGLGSDAVHGLRLYRANVLDRIRHRRPLRTDLPVLVVHPTHDAFLTAVLTEDLDRIGPHVRLERVDAGHWVTVTHADRLAELVRRHVGDHA